jgi:hypothetical protein
LPGFLNHADVDLALLMFHLALRILRHEESVMAKRKLKSEPAPRVVARAEKALNKLKRAVDTGPSSLAAFERTVFPIVFAVFEHLDRLGDQIDRGFESRPILLQRYPVMVRQFEAQIQLQGRLIKLLGKALDLVAKSAGINYEGLHGSAASLTANCQAPTQNGSHLECSKPDIGTGGGSIQRGRLKRPDPQRGHAEEGRVQ